MRAALVLALLAAGAFALGPGAREAHALAKPSYAHYLKALLLQRQGLYDEALREYQAAATIDPDAPYVLQQAAELALDIGQTGLAAEFAESLAAKAPEDPKTHLLVGNVRWSQGDVEGARRSYERALVLDPEFSEALFSMANLLSEPDPETAKQYYLRYLEQNPDAAAEVHYHIALIENRLGREEEAAKRLRQALESDPEFLQARYSLAQLFEARHDTEAARQEYLAILPLDEQNVGLLARLGELSFHSGERSEAEGFFRRAVAIEPGHPASRFWLAFLAEEKADFSAAAEELSKSGALSEDSGLSLRLSYYLTQAARLEEAVAILEAARKRWPEDPEVGYFLALGQDDLGRTAEALETMRSVVRLKPDSREARFQLAAWAERLGRMDEAEREFRRLLEDKPDDAVALNYLGYSLADRGLKLPEAERLIRRAVALEPANAAYLDSLAWVHHKQGRHAEALEEIQRALGLPSGQAAAGEDSALLEHLGAIQSALGRRGEAWLAWMLSRHHGGEAKTLTPLLAEAASKLEDKELAALHLRFFRQATGPLARLDGFCTVEGRVGPAKLAFTGLLSYRGEEDRLKLDVLGPMLVPLWSLSGTAQGVDLGGMQAPGLDPKAFEAAARKVLEVLRLYFKGAYLEGEEGKLKKGWSKTWIETDRATLFFDRETGRLQSLRPRADRDHLLEFKDPVLSAGRAIPTVLTVQGPGFTVTLKLNEPRAETSAAR